MGLPPVFRRPIAPPPFKPPWPPMPDPKIWFDPDLIATICDRKMRHVVKKYLSAKRFVPVAIIKNRRCRRRAYWAKKDSVLYDEIAQRLTGIDSVEYDTVEYADITDFLDKNYLPEQTRRRRKGDGIKSE